MTCVTNLCTRSTLRVFRLPRAPPQIMNVGLPQTASFRQCPSSFAVPLTSLISAFISPPPSLKLPLQCRAAWLLRAITTVNCCMYSMSGRDRCNKQLHKPKWIIFLKSTRWKNIPHLIALSTTTSVRLHAVSLTNYCGGNSRGKSGVCSSCKTRRQDDGWFEFSHNLDEHAYLFI